MIIAKIKDIKYIHKIKYNTQEFYDANDINILPSVSVLKINNSLTMGLSKWVSPKRTRSYPFSRVFRSLNSAAKHVTIIPAVKDEGIGGDRDYLQWDTISLMSLLNVYVIIGYYSSAQRSDKPNKITAQKYDNEYILEVFKKLQNYHQSALHWNLNQISKQLPIVAQKAKESYKEISDSLGVEVHSQIGIDTNIIDKLTNGVHDFLQHSREKAEQAQNREYLTTQPKENLVGDKKDKITISNYLGGHYYFTVDEAIMKNETLYLCECKHSKYEKLPKQADIEEALLKIILYCNLEEVIYNGMHVKFKPVIKLTNDNKLFKVKLPCNTDILHNTLDKVKPLSKVTREFYIQLNEEAIANNFEVLIGNVEI